MNFSNPETSQSNPTRRYFLRSLSGAAIAFLARPSFASTDQPSPYFPVDPEWGVIESVLKRAHWLEQPQPQFGSFSKSFFDNAGVLEDGKSNPGTTKGWRLTLPEGSIPEDTLVPGIVINFPATSESISLSFLKQNGVLRVAEKYNPGETKWIPRSGVLTISDFKEDQPTRLVAIYDQMGEARKRIIDKGFHGSEEIYPQDFPIFAKK